MADVPLIDYTLRGLRECGVDSVVFRGAVVYRDIVEGSVVGENVVIEENVVVTG